jgi:hypothetical protein
LRGVGIHAGPGDTRWNLPHQDREISRDNETSRLETGSVINRRLIDRRLMWLLCSFQGPWRGDNASPPFASAVAIFLIAAALRASGRRSLKAQQHAGGLCAVHPIPRTSRYRAGWSDGAPVRFGRHARPGLLCHQPLCSDPKVFRSSDGRVDRGTVCAP